LKQPKSHTAATGGRGALPMRCHSRHGEHACRRLRIGRHCRAGTAGGAPTGSARDDQNRHPHAHRTRQAPNNNVRNTRTDWSHQLPTALQRTPVTMPYRRNPRHSTGTFQTTTVTRDGKVGTAKMDRRQWRWQRNGAGTGGSMVTSSQATSRSLVPADTYSHSTHAQ
jgi:hypothetical protein